MENETRTIDTTPTLLVTSDKFIWLDVTERMKEDPTLWPAGELYAVHDDESESLLESVEAMLEAINHGERICTDAAIANAKSIHGGLDHLRAACTYGAKFKRIEDGTDNEDLDIGTYAVLINGDTLGYVRSHYEGWVPIWFAYRVYEDLDIGPSLGCGSDSRRGATAQVINSTLESLDNHGDNPMEYATAHAFASFALKGKTDKAGDPLIAHAERMADLDLGDDHRVLSILHDVIEDSDATLSFDHSSWRSIYYGNSIRGTLSLGDLRLALAPEVAWALKLITRLSSETYDEYIGRVATYPLAAAVKIADLRDHLERADNISASLAKRYRKSLAYLEVSLETA